MFDQEQAKTNSAPGNLPVEPADIFSGVEKDVPQVEKMPDALSSGLLKKKEAGMTSPLSSAGTPPQNIMPATTTSSPFKIVGVLLIIVAVLGGLGLGGWWMYSRSKSTPLVEAPADVTTAPVTPAPTVVEPPVIEPEPVPAVTVTTTSNDTLLFGSQTDTDRDGLDDVREGQLGTNSALADTDGDLLSDGDEVIVWKTDPLNPDTDGDTFSDGAEIKNGYSPTGPGKLFPTATTTPPAARSSSTPL